MRQTVLGVALLLSFTALGACSNGDAGVAAARGTGVLGEPAPRGRADQTRIDNCGPGTVTAAGATDVLRRPYLQRTGPESTWLVWTSLRGEEGLQVEVNLPDGTPVTTAAPAVDPTASPTGASQLEAHLEGLAPSTLYCWSIKRGDTVLVEPTGFRTAPEVGSEGDVSFLVFGDSGSGGADQTAVLSQMENVPFDFVLILGDVAYDDGTLGQFEDKVFDVYADLFRSFPVFPITGNHDYHTAEAAPFREVFMLPENGGVEGIERWYSFDWGTIHFVALDTERVGPAQVAWLEADLAATAQPWKIAYLHRPPYSSGEHGSNLTVRNQFGPVFARHGVQLVLAGHDHDYERTDVIDGTTYIVSGGGGKSTRPVTESSWTAFSEEVLHFLLVRTDGDRLRVHAIDATGREFDSTEILRP